MPLPDTDIAYLAGFLDGEASITIVMLNAKNFYVMPRLSVSNTDLAVLQWIHQAFPGGRLYTFRKQTNIRNVNARPIHRIDWTTGAIEAILRQVLPYLRVKRRQAEMVLQLLAFRKAERQTRLVCRPRSAETLAHYRQFHADMKALNRRGVRHSAA